MIDRRTLLQTAALTLAAGPALADDAYPNRPIRLIVGFPPGGPLDVMARLTANALHPALGQMVVDNKPGAGGTLAGRETVRAEPDGYTLLFGSSATLAIGPALYGNSGYDPVKSFTPIAMVSSVPYVMIGAADAPFKSVAELLTYSKAHPNTINFGVPNGAPPHMLAEMFKASTGADIQIVPYKGASTLITDMLAGRIHGGFETTSVMIAHLKQGDIRGLAVVRDNRIAELGDIPTMKECGVQGVEGSSWSGMLAPAGTPQRIVDKIRADVLAALKTPEFTSKLKVMMADSPEMSAAEFGSFIASEYRRIAAVMKTAGLTAQ